MIITTCDTLPASYSSVASYIGRLGSPSSAAAMLPDSEWKSTVGPVFEIGRTASQTIGSGYYVYNQVSFCKLPSLHEEFVIRNRDDVLMYVLEHPKVIQVVNKLYEVMMQGYEIRDVSLEYVKDADTDFCTLNVVPKFMPHVSVDDALEIGDRVFDDVLLNLDPEVRGKLTLTCW